MNDPIATAKRVLETMSITGIPAESLKEIARREGIKCKFENFPEDAGLEGLLVSKGGKWAIVVNTCIDNPGKHNFTFAHELGHYFLKHPLGLHKDGQDMIRCSPEDIKQERSPQEAEANRFAVELLMPEERFRLSMAGAPIDFDLIASLSTRYMVSKHACSNRIISLTKSPCIIIRTNNGNIQGYTASRSARGFLQNLKRIPNGTAADKAIQDKKGQDIFVECDAHAWLSRDIPGKLYECTHVHADSATAMTILKW